MSIIYRSLQQLKRQQAQQKTPPIPRSTGIMPSPWQVLWRIIFSIVGIGAIIYAGFFWTSGQIQKELPAGNYNSVKEYDNTSKKKQKPATASIKQTNEKKEFFTHTFQIEARKKPPPKKPETIQKPTRALEKYFTVQAQKNQKISALNIEIMNAFRNNDEKGFQNGIARLKKLLGKNSFLVKKWLGVRALKQGKYRQAEQYFRTAILKNPSDLALRINLVYALLGSGDITTASKETEKLLREFPYSKKVQHLAQKIEQLTGE